DGNAVIAGSSFQTGPGTGSTKLALARYVVSAPASFSLSFDPALATGERGTTVKVKVLIGRTSGVGSNVTVTPPDTSSIGIKVKPPLPLSTTDSTVIFKLKIKAAAVLGSQQLSFSASDDSGHTTSATLTILIQ